MKRVLLSWTTLAAIALATTSCSQWGSSRTLPGEINNSQYDNQEPLDKGPSSTTDR